MRRLEALVSRYGLDLLVGLVAVEGTVEALLEQDARGGGTGGFVAGVAVAIVVLPLLARRRLPFGAPLAVWVLAALLSFVDGPLVVETFSVYVGGVAAAFLLGGIDDRTRAQAGLAAVLVAAAVIVANSPNPSPGNFVFIPAVFALAWLAGLALRRRSDQAEAAEQRASWAERERESAARLAVAEERARIARELHDIVAHAMSVMVLQVGAVRHGLPPTLAEDKDALRAVERAGRSALAEMRRLLGALHDEGTSADLAPQPGLDRLGALADEVRRAGLPVDVTVEGDAVPLPPAVDLSAYRIVQEALTNALKHARAGHAEVVVRYDRTAVALQVSDDGVGVQPGDGLGHGLVGVRERVKIYGGDMSAGALPGGGFRLTARLPLQRSAP